MKTLVSRIAILAISSFTTSIAPAQEVRLVPVPANQISLKQLQLALIPTTVDPVIQFRQAFTLMASGSPLLTVSPVLFVDSPENSTWNNCGVYFLPENGKQTFVTLFGSDDPGHCTGTRAIGIMSDPGPRPRLIFICDVISPHGSDDTLEPIILSWDAMNSAYKRNEEQTDWLYGKGMSIATVANVRRLLTRYKQTP